MFALLLLLCVWLQPDCDAADPAFDLAGPKVDVHVKRGEVTLPIGEVPNLLPGDRLWIHPDLPESQSAHFVLIVAFLRGATNPPPPEWFTRVETWTRDGARRGRLCHGSRGSAAGADLSGAGDGRRLQHPARSRARPPRRLCPRRPGSAGRQLGPHAAGCLPGRGEGDLPDRPQSARRNAPRRRRAAWASSSTSNASTSPATSRLPAWRSTPKGWCWTTPTRNRGWTQLTNGSTVDLMNQLSSSPMARRGRIQPVCRRHRGHGQDPRLAAHGAFSVHSGAGAANQRYAQPAAERAALVPRSQVGGGGGAAAGGPGQGRRRCIR